MGHYRVYLKITVGLLAQISGRSERAVRRYIERGVFDPGDWHSINEWVAKYGRMSG